MREGWRAGRNLGWNRDYTGILLLDVWQNSWLNQSAGVWDDPKPVFDE